MVTLRLVEPDERAEPPAEPEELLQECAEWLRGAASRVTPGDAWLRDFFAAELRHAELLLGLERLPGGAS